MVELKFQGYASLKPGEKLQPWEYEPAPLGSNDVEIAVTHNGLCHMIETIPISQINAAMDRVVANKARYRIVLV
ncbi:hypothetical protein PN480_08875 [Dolichospermum circinale CS-1225]|uniref:Uncharacterized protein n=1 Tax=Dolichospermum circinale CS-537/01 TaxID=3021739 RepID=A0ABT5A118_9CYAN|nr:hypothetical protein [Dolichospermum circinale]MDB9458025.1 hypothetical protein [Dolichospermum circinale CS-545/17]MDB9468524.1 hypothetical protein [Dolichospermum circinale CS-539/09]MDB9470756.1 hypothetical protein [Dolichospermum circinale CS-539]MDB9485635.1 hypothetical protein [Dolichospermum circinale CS-537/01]MDB9522062.1 hypothetical protein [Dolichospermum circinale CS-1225]